MFVSSTSFRCRVNAGSVLITINISGARIKAMHSGTLAQREVYLISSRLSELEINSVLCELFML